MRQKEWVLGDRGEFSEFCPAEGEIQCPEIGQIRLKGAHLLIIGCISFLCDGEKVSELSRKHHRNLSSSLTRVTSIHEE